MQLNLPRLPTPPGFHIIPSLTSSPLSGDVLLRPTSLRGQHDRFTRHSRTVQGLSEKAAIPRPYLCVYAQLVGQTLPPLSPWPVRQKHRVSHGLK